MRRNPLYVFKDESAIGVYEIPLNSVIQILQTVGGRVLLIEIIGKSGLVPASTIGDLLLKPHLYNVLSDGTGGGEVVKRKENSKTGYKLNDTSLEDYGPVGASSIDFSFQIDSPSSEGGTVGDYSFATGQYTNALGNYSSVFGLETTASGLYSVAFGNKTIASGESSIVSGIDTQSEGRASFSTGLLSKALGEASFASGYNSLATGFASNAESYGNLAEGNYSHAEGSLTRAEAESSHAEGFKTKTVKDDNIPADAKYAHVEGQETVAYGTAAHAEGRATKAVGDYSHSEGRNTEAMGAYSHAEGLGSIADGNFSHAGGGYTQAIGEGSFTTGYETAASGLYSAAFNYKTKTEADFSIAFGSETLTAITALNSLAGGTLTRTEGVNSVALGRETVAIGENSVAIGLNTIAQGKSSFAGGTSSTSEGEGGFAFGSGATSLNDYSVAFGANTTAVESFSAAFGQGTKANRSYSLVGGYYNVGLIDSVFEIGVGAGDANRLNALEIQDTGIIKAPQMSGLVYNTPGLDGYTLATIEMLQDVETELTINIRSQLQYIDDTLTTGNYGWRIIDRDPNKHIAIGEGAIDLTFSTQNNDGSDDIGAGGNYSFTANKNVSASAENSAAFGTNSKARGINSFVINQLNKAEGLNAFASGLNNESIGDNTFTGGFSNKTFGENSVALGSQNISNGENSITSGILNVANGENSVVFGRENRVDGLNTLAVGSGLTTNGNNTISIGLNSTVNGNSNSFGNSNNIQGNQSAILGSYNGISGNNSFIIGTNNILGIDDGYVFGENNVITVSRTIMIGRNLMREQSGTHSDLIAMGSYNLGLNPNNIFEYGNGVSEINRANAFEIHRSGMAFLPQVTLADMDSATDDIIITKGYIRQIEGYLGKIVNPFDENDFGYAIKEREDLIPGEQYLAPGLYSVDLGYADGGATDNNPSAQKTGAIGHASFVAGKYSHADTISNVNPNDLSGVGGAIALGYSARSLGNGAFASGFCTDAVGKGAHTEGMYTRVNGADAGHAEGYATEVFGDAAHAEGKGTIALNNNSHSEGQYNVGTSTDTIHETGIGLDNANRVNAFEVYMNGRLVAPELSPAIINDNSSNLSARTLITKEYLEIYGGGSFTQYNFNAFGGQTAFTLNDVATAKVKVFCDGIATRNSDYIAIPNINTNQTEIIFNEPRMLNEEVIIEVYAGSHGSFDFDSTDNQTDFTVPDKIFMVAEIHVDGVLSPKNKYIIINDGTNTTIIFNEGLRENVWVNISY